MIREWLLVETLGPQPVVVAQGRQPKKLIPVAFFLRRNPDRPLILQAIAETVRSGRGLVVSTTGGRIIRTEPVIMSDACVHGIQVWTGASLAHPPERPEIGATTWDLTTGRAADTPTALANGGLDPRVERTQGRLFAEDLPISDLNRDETKVLAWIIRATPNQTLYSTWDVTGHTGELITVSFVGRARTEQSPDGTEHLVSRGMNWRNPPQQPRPLPVADLSHRIVKAMAQPGVHRAIVDLTNWNLLKLLDPPSPLVDWRSPETGGSIGHPDDEQLLRSLTPDTAGDAASALVRLRRRGGGWTVVHVTVHRVELDDDTNAGLITTRLPTPAELAKMPAPSSATPGS